MMKNHVVLKIIVDNLRKIISTNFDHKHEIFIFPIDVGRDSSSTSPHTTIPTSPVPLMRRKKKGEKKTKLKPVALEDQIYCCTNKCCIIFIDVYGFCIH